MNKPLKIAPWVVPVDLQAIYDYHRVLSLGKAERIVAEYDRIVDLLNENPLVFHERLGGWRVYPFSSGTYLAALSGMSYGIVASSLVAAPR